MTNEQYLVVSYFAAGAGSVALAGATYALLRRSFAGVAAVPAGGAFGRILRPLFLPGLLLPALAGFLGVAFKSCTRDTYAEVVADRAYLVSRNQAQVQAALSRLWLALLVWGLIVTLGVALTARGRRQTAGGEAPGNRGRDLGT
jgi:hypothetical protein